MEAGAGLAFAMDGATVVGGAWNAGWLAARQRGERRPSRRHALAALALLHASIALEAAYAQVFFAAHRFGWPHDGLFAPPVWIAARAPLLAGVLLMSALVLRGRRHPPQRL